MVSEENIIRSTYYCPKYLHNKAKEAGINISKELTTYLETILFGDNVCDVTHQREQLAQKKKSLEIELTSINSRILELDNLIEEHDVKLAIDQKLFDRFLNHCKGRIKNAESGQMSIDYRHLLTYWKKDYFPGNGMNEKTTIQIIDKIRKNSFEFEDFKALRKGDVFEN